MTDRAKTAQADRRLRDYELFFHLLIALDAEHKARTRHDYTNRDDWRTATCDTCMSLRAISRELESRQYDGMEEASAHES